MQKGFLIVTSVIQLEVIWGHNDGMDTMTQEGIWDERFLSYLCREANLKHLLFSTLHFPDSLLNLSSYSLSLLPCPHEKIEHEM